MGSMSAALTGLVAGCLLVGSSAATVSAGGPGSPVGARLPADSSAQPVLRLALTLEGDVPANAMIMREGVFLGVVVCAPASSTSGSLSTAPRPPTCRGGRTYVFADPKPAGSPIDYRYVLSYCRDTHCETRTGFTVIWRVHHTMPSVTTTYRRTYAFASMPPTDAEVISAPRGQSSGLLSVVPALAGLVTLMWGLARPGRRMLRWRIYRTRRAARVGRGEGDTALKAHP